MEKYLVAILWYAVFNCIYFLDQKLISKKEYSDEVRAMAAVIGLFVLYGGLYLILGGK